MKKFNLLLVLLCLACNISSWAQGENNVWCFGRRTTATFTGGTPVFSENNMEVYECSSSVSDAAGNLLFYTSGSKIWDASGNLMPNGTALAGSTGSSMNGVAIVQSVSNPDQYYVITTDEFESGLANAYYSVVDMNLNGGLGDVVPGQASVLIDTGLAEGVLVTPIPGCSGYWLVLHRRYTPQYMAYHIGAGGFAGTPVISTSPFPPVINSFFGYGTFNNAGNRVVYSWSQLVETASFDDNTGIFSDFIKLDFTPNALYYNIFSPNDQKIYFSGIEPSNPFGTLFQADISLLPNVAAVESSLTPVAFFSCRGMRMGPDNKIYSLRTMPGYLARINNPNATGLACDPDTNFLQFPVYTTIMPNAPAMFLELGKPALTLRPDTMVTVKDTTICFLENATLQAPAGYQAYRWNTGDTGPSININQEGTYWVSGKKECTWHIDSFRVTFNRFTITLGPDTFICPGQTLLLDVTMPGATYLWQDGSTQPDFTVSQAGTYRVKVTLNGCTGADTMYIEAVNPQLSIQEPDTLICTGTPLILHVVAIPVSEFLWSNGSTEDHILVTEKGTYTVTATNACGTLHDEVTVDEVTCNCDRPFVPNAFTPNKDGTNEVLGVKLNCPGATDFYFAIYNRYGQRVFESKNPDVGWNGSHNGHKADIGTYFYRLQYKTNEGAEIKKKGDVILLH